MTDTPTLTAVGWFEGASEQPAHDPGFDVPCPVCGTSLQRGPRVSPSFLTQYSEVSYFFRAHRDCWNGLLEAQQAVIFDSLVDALAPPAP